MNFIALALATALGAGYAPVAPGTFGSAVGLLLWLVLPASPAVQLAVIVAVFVLGAWGGSVDLRRCRQVTVADVCEGRADPVLDIPHDNGWTHRDRIAHYERMIEGGAAIDPVLCGVHVPADGERVLMDGCHRACAGFNRWDRMGELQLTMLCGPPGHGPVDADPRLHGSGRSGGGVCPVPGGR